MSLSSLLVKTAFFGGLLTNLIAVFPATAQVGMSPLFIEAEAVRGRAQGVITLINPTDRPMRMRVYSEPFTYDQDGFVSLQEATDDLSPYLQFSPREVLMEPRSEQRVRLLGLFPPSLPAREYRAAIFAEELTDSSVEQVGIAINARVGTTVYMRQGELSGELTELSAAPNGQFIDLIVANQGQATVRPRVFWKLTQNGSQVASGEESEHTIVSEGDRKISLALSDALPSGSYTLTGELAWATLEKGYSQAFELPVLVP